MARIRSIKPELRTSITVSLWPREVRYFFILLWGYLDDYGRGVDDELLIASDCFPRDRDVTPERVDDWLELIAEAGPVCRYEVDGRRYLHAVNWREHQKPSHPTNSKIPPCPDDEPDRFKEWREHHPQRLRNRSRKSREGFQKIPEDSPHPSEKPSGEAPGATLDDSGDEKPTSSAEADANNESTSELAGQATFDSPPESLANPSGDAPEHFVPEQGSKGAREQGSKGAREQGSKGEGGAGGTGRRDLERQTTRPANRPDGRPPLTELPDDFTVSDAMRGWARNTYPRVDVDHETRKFISHFRGEQTRKRNWYEAWKRWIADGNAYLIKHGSKSTNVVDFSTGQPLTGTDVTVAGWGAVADSFGPEESHESA